MKNIANYVEKEVEINEIFSFGALLPELQEVNDTLLAAVSQNSSITAQIGNHLVDSGGKRIRPLLTIISGSCLRGNKAKLVTAGSAIELIHMASLVHDDIIDKAHLRRGRPSVNAKWGEKSAVLMGDYLFAKAFHLLAKENLIETLQLVVVAIQEMCDGELTQAKYIFNPQQTVQDYYSRIYQKTALLIATCCQAGGIISQGTEEEVAALYQYGLHLGYAFQIADDLLDFTGSEQELGKPVGSDLAQGNITLPVLLLMKEPQWASFFKKKLAQAQLSPADLLHVQEGLIASGALKAAYAQAYNHIVQAKKELAILEPSAHRGILESLAELVVSRKH